MALNDSPGSQRHVELALEDQPRKCAEQHDDARVDDVAAIAAPIPRDETEEGHHRVLAVHAHARADTLVELLQDRGRDEAGERVGDERVRLPQSEREQQ